MNRIFRINEKIKPFKKKIFVESDKSLSNRWILFSSLSSKKSVANNLLMSEDVLSAIDCIRKLGSKVKFKGNKCEIIGNGLKYKIKNNLILNAGNSGTLGRLLLGLLVNSEKKIKLIGDKSLSKRDFKRIAEPLNKFGANLSLKENN